MAVTIDEMPSEMTLKPTLSFEGLYRSEWRRVLGLAYALSGSRWAAEDIAQEAFLRAHRDWDRVRGFEHPGSWVRTVTVNLARSRLRRAGAEVHALTRWVGMQPTAFPELWATNASWLNRIEAQSQALRYFTLDGTDHQTHQEQNSMIRRYIRWRNTNAHDKTLREITKRANVA